MRTGCSDGDHRSTTSDGRFGIACVTALTLALLPCSVGAQVGVAAQVGTMGFGGEAAVGLGERVVFRGGVGLSTLAVTTTIDSLPVDLDMPRDWFTLGVDYYLDAAFRLSGGLVFRPDDIGVTGSFTGPVMLGGETLAPTQIGNLSGLIATDNTAPYLLIGFGRHVTPGLGLSLDVGAAWFGDPDVALDATGGSYPRADLVPLLRAEEQEFRDDMKTYVRVWPILRLALRFGFGSPDPAEDPTP